MEQEVNLFFGESFHVRHFHIHPHGLFPTQEVVKLSSEVSFTKGDTEKFVITKSMIMHNIYPLHHLSLLSGWVGGRGRYSGKI